MSGELFFTRMKPDLFSLSKFLSLVLRHKPDEIGLTLDSNGWANIEELLKFSVARGHPLTRAMIDEVVLTNDKKRFVISADGSMIRANQGHSIPVDLELPEIEPPDLLYHGTATRFVSSIRVEGLIKGSRQHVHLSADEETALKVGKRHGKPIVLLVNTGKMYQLGHLFYFSANGVWLTDHVPPDYIEDT